MEDGDIELQPNGTFVFSDQCARRALYHDCSPEVVAASIAQLRPQRSLWTEVSPNPSWPQTTFASIVCTNDRIVAPAWSARVARDRLGVEPIMFASGHSPMLSHADELAAVIDGIAR
jgi:hypothetical protein